MASKLSAVAKKRSYDDPSLGRKATAGAFGAFHGAVAGRSGSKLRATGNEGGGTLLGGMAGRVAGGLAGRATGHEAGMLIGASLGQAVGGTGGALAGLKRNLKRGYLKPEADGKDFGKAKSFATRDQNSGGLVRVQPRLPDGRYASHSNDVKHVKVSPAHPRDARLQRYTKTGNSPWGAGAKVGRAMR